MCPEWRNKCWTFLYDSVARSIFDDRQFLTYKIFSHNRFEFFLSTSSRVQGQKIIFEFEVFQKQPFTMKTLFRSRWWVAFACGWINFFIFAVFRSSGVFYISLKETFNCTNQQAAWPVSISGSIASTCGIAAGFASHYIPLRLIVIFGILVASVSVSVTYYANTIQFVTLTIGFFQGKFIVFFCMIF